MLWLSVSLATPRQATEGHVSCSAIDKIDGVRDDGRRVQARPQRDHPVERARDHHRWPPVSAKPLLGLFTQMRTTRTRDVAPSRSLASLTRLNQRGRWSAGHESDPTAISAACSGIVYHGDLLKMTGAEVEAFTGSHGSSSNTLHDGREHRLCAIRTSWWPSVPGQRQVGHSNTLERRASGVRVEVRTVDGVDGSHARAEGHLMGCLARPMCPLRGVRRAAFYIGHESSRRHGACLLDVYWLTVPFARARSRKEQRRESLRTGSTVPAATLGRHARRAILRRRRPQRADQDDGGGAGGEEASTLMNVRPAGPAGGQLRWWRRRASSGRRRARCRCRR